MKALKKKITKCEVRRSEWKETTLISESGKQSAEKRGKVEWLVK